MPKSTQTRAWPGCRVKKPLLTIIATTRSNTLPKRVKRDTANRPTSASFDRLMVELTMSSMDTA